MSDSWRMTECRHRPRSGDCVVCLADEVASLRADNAALRRALAQRTAEYVFLDGGNFAKIDLLIRQYGYRLSNADPQDGRIPKIVEADSPEGR
jgi:hypothetical protein